MAPEKMMSISVNGESKVPPGFRFHPTEEELLLYYLRKKVSFQQIDLDVIQDVDLNKLEPWDIQEKCKIGSTPQNDWYFFSHKDKKYPTGTRTNRATFSGFWKATGRDKVIYSNSNKIGMRKTLVFYKGRAPHGLKSDWIMHEYRLDINHDSDHTSNVMYVDFAGDQTTQEEGWVVCRVFRKKNHYKTLDDDTTPTEIRIPVMRNQGTFEETIEYMEMNFNEETNATQFPSLIDNISDKFTQLPTLDNPNSTVDYQPIHLLQMINNQVISSRDANLEDLDQLVASHLNGGVQSDDMTRQQACSFINDPNALICCCYPTPSLAAIHDLQTLQLRSLSPSSSAERLYHCHQDYSTELDLWSIDPSL